MMRSFGDLRRRAIDGYLKAVRAPADAGLRLARHAAGDRVGPATLVVDRAEAMVRKTLGQLLRDEELARDGERREIATAERERALELREAADAKSREAVDAFQQRRETAARIEAAAHEQAEAQRERAEADRVEAERRVAAEARDRKAAVRKAAQAVEHQVEKSERRAKLAQLETEADALAAEEAALAAGQIAHELQEDAAAIKAARTANRQR